MTDLPLGTIIHGDSLEEMQKLPDGCIDLIFTSPPYNLRKSLDNKSRRNGSLWTTNKLGDGYDCHEDAMPYPEYVQWQKEVLLECWRLLTPDGAIYYNHKCRLIDGEMHTPLEFNPGLPLRQIVTWWRAGWKINFTISAYAPETEWIIILAKPDFRLKDKRVSAFGDVWNITPDQKNPHPAPFPVALPLRAINSTNCKIVLDPFMGSGSTAIACINADHPVNYIGIEKSAKYIKQTETRIALAKAQGRFSFDFEETAS